MQDTHSNDELNQAADMKQSADAGQLDTAEQSVPTVPAPEPVHRWLDGEDVPEGDLGAPDAAKHVRFWAKVNDETARRRRMMTPTGLDAIIMSKLEAPIVKDD